MLNVMLAASNPSFFESVLSALSNIASTIANGLSFFNGALRVLWSGLTSLMAVFGDLPSFLVAFLGLGMFLIVGNIILKVI